MSVRIDGKFVSGLEMQMSHGPSGTILFTDPPRDNGGEGKSFSPTDLVATAYGACMMSIIALQAKKDGIALDGMHVQVDKHMSKDLPRRIIALDVHLVLPANLDTGTRARYIDAARNCPVAKSVHSDISINFTDA